MFVFVSSVRFVVCPVSKYCTLRIKSNSLYDNIPIKFLSDEVDESLNGKRTVTIQTLTD